MKWRGRRESENVETAGGGLGRMVPVGGVGTIVLGLVIYFLTGDSSVVLNGLNDAAHSGGAGQTTERAKPGSGSDEQKFVAVVLADTEDVWGELFRRMGKRYREPKIVLYSDRVQSACGLAGSAMGPFYCPSDEKLYLDISFFKQMKSQLGAPGDFAQAYVIAHEVGHHVQKQLGTMERVHEQMQQGDERAANQLSVKLELQADYYAGVWAHYAQKRDLLDTGDVEEALNAASAVGDDKLQKESRGYVVPDSFTHGTSQQRVAAFRKGMEAGGESLSTR